MLARYSVGRLSHGIGVVLVYSELIEVDVLWDNLMIRSSPLSYTGKDSFLSFLCRYYGGIKYL